MAYYLGIDTGSKNIGAAIFDTNSKKIIYWKHITPENRVDWYNELEKIFKKYPNLIEKVIIEKPFAHPSTLGILFKVIEYIGILNLFLERKNIEGVLVSPSSAKKAFTGNGKATKLDMHNAVVEYFGIDTKNNHVDDAIGIVVGWCLNSKLINSLCQQ